MASVVAVALAVALVVGVPHPAVIERGAAAAFGLLGLGAGSIALSTAVDSGFLSGARSPRRGEEPAEAAVASFVSLERSLRFGASTAGDFYAQVRPRLVALVSTSLARKGVSLSDRARAVELLGAEGYGLVEPDRAPPADRFDPGVPLEQVRRLLDRLDALAGHR